MRMTVVSVFTGQPKPGRYDDVMAINDKTKKILERYGAKNICVLVGGRVYECLWKCPQQL
jgi:hypothetical protein